MGVIISKEFHRAIDLDGSLKSKAWDFLTKLSRDTDLTGLDLKLPQSAMDRRVRTARASTSTTAPCCSPSGTRPSRCGCSRRSSRTTTAYTYAETLTLEINPANGAMEVLRGAAIGAKVAEFRKRPTTEDAVQVLPFSAAELVDLGINPDIAAEAIRLTSDDEVLDLAADLPEWQQRVLVGGDPGLWVPERCHKR